MTIDDSLLSLSANTIRCLSIDAIQAAKSGHPGLPLGLADVATVLWLKYLKHDPKNPAWADRDRFVLSGGHGSMLLYSLLHLSGYGVSLDDISTPPEPEPLLPVGPRVLQEKPKPKKRPPIGHPIVRMNG